MLPQFQKWSWRACQISPLPTAQQYFLQLHSHILIETCTLWLIDTVSRVRKLWRHLCSVEANSTFKHNESLLCFFPAPCEFQHVCLHTEYKSSSAHMLCKSLSGAVVLHHPPPRLLISLTLHLKTAMRHSMQLKYLYLPIYQVITVLFIVTATARQYAFSRQHFRLMGRATIASTLNEH